MNTATIHVAFAWTAGHLHEQLKQCHRGGKGSTATMPIAAIAQVWDRTDKPSWLAVCLQFIALTQIEDHLESG